MLKKQITYKDFNGEDTTEEFYFNLTKAELAEMELSMRGGMVEYLKSIVRSEDGAAIIAAFKKILKASYGRRSEDGKRFVKRDEYWDEFQSSEAYSELFMELVTNAEASAAFINGIMPKDLADKAAGAVVETVTAHPLQDDRPAWMREGREPTPKELREATPDQLREAWLAKTGGKEATT